MTEKPKNPNGCYNHKPYVDTVIVPDGWDYFRDGKNQPQRTPLLKDIPNPMTKDCQYTLHQNNHADPRCAGCIWQAQPQLEGMA